ncbi:leucine--tRNA ligase [Lutibacter sp. B1]|uniref:leucine--tRNA ligase n=1 Tax=Lutibacter sp. B1 TaxID=2725996 RepID=UPI0014576B13|nr:class I tRNA ligase family protein [Lutibacter sp. B1]NLP57789.1 leucine--tRNA ligase [Lutibacter sp. B1]
MEYNFREIEANWQKYWAENETFKAENPALSRAEGELNKPKFYVLDMFPYPSGAGLHVGHPLGYIASDIYARYKRHKGFNVLHPQGYDSFGLPAEQYAIQTGQHPAITTEANIATYRKQLDKIGFSFDWSREVRTSDPKYYKWTQWIFIQLFNSYYCKDADQARSISELEEVFTAEGNTRINAACDDDVQTFTAEDWNSFSEEEKQKILLKYRLTYLSETEVNWCPDLGTVLANDEIVNGVSERGGHPVVRKKMKQWSMRITAYAQRLLDGLNKIDWPQPLKDSQTYWIGRSEGAMVSFPVIPAEAGISSRENISVFTTRPDTIFGVSFMTLAPEHELVSKITTEAQKAEVEAYVKATAKRSELDRMADVKTISGVFTGAYALHPFTGEKVQIWIGDYVLASYGTGAVMAVPCGDQRDYDFAKHFGLEIPNIFQDVDISEEANADKDNSIIANSDFLNGLPYKKAMKRIIYEIEQRGFGYGKINYRLRDAVFSRQRYWGEPFPVYYKNGLPQMIDEKYLPLELPEVEKYLPTEDGKPPLGNATVWAWDTVKNEVVSNEKINNETVFPLELNTMPGWAGSSQYFNRYMDSQNEDEIFSQEAVNYWQDVDLYIGGSEHATGHLLYSRFWQKFMFDRGFVPKDEYAKKLINQGMITGTSAFVKRLDAQLHKYEDGKLKSAEGLSGIPAIFISENKKIQDYQEYIVNHIKKYVSEEILEEFNNTNNLRFNVGQSKIHSDVSFVNSHDELDIEAFKNWRSEFKNAEFILEEDGTFKVSREVEKMSKSKYNVVNPDQICEEYGADSLRLFEMFLGPLEQSKPWKTSGISGVYSFLKKLWKLYHSGENGAFFVSDDEPTKDEFKVLHKTIKKVEDDIENFSFNTSVSTFMIAVNELTALKCNKRTILEPLAIIIEPYAPHIAEELWSKLGHTTSISTVDFPVFEPKYLVESSKEYPVSFNGKMRFKIELPLDLTKEEIEAAVMAHEKTKEQLQGRIPKKVIVVPGKIVNVVG